VSASVAPAAPQAVASATPGTPAAAQSGSQQGPYTVHSFTRPADGYPNAKPAPFVSAAPAPQPEAAPAPAPAAKPAASADESESASAVDPARANDPWFRFVDRVKKANSLLGAMLENTHMIGTEGSKITIGVPRKMSFMFDKVKEPENVKRIETFLETFWNKAYTVEVKLADEKTVEKATPKALADQHKEDQKKSVANAVEQNPLVQTAQNVFKTQIKSIKDAGATAKPATSAKPSTNRE
jgi:hypothetical protein